MLDMYDFENDIWLCHSFQGECFNITAFVWSMIPQLQFNVQYFCLGRFVTCTLYSFQQPAINTLREVEAFLTQNPTEIVTIIIEDYVHTTKGLTKLFANAGLDKYWFPLSKMPKKGADWPTITKMVQENHRLLVFTSDSSKEVGEGIAYQWRYILENERKCLKLIDLFVFSSVLHKLLSSL